MFITKDKKRLKTVVKIWLNEPVGNGTKKKDTSA